MGVTTNENLVQELEKKAIELGFCSIGICDTDLDQHIAHKLKQFVDLERFGDMAWIGETLHRRQNPIHMWPDAKSAIMLGMNYGPEHNPLEQLNHKNQGVVSVYAQNHDYHDLIKKKLKQLAGWFHRETGSEVKVFVDTAPLMEKPLAQKSGLGWQGKHTNLVSREYGSWLFLGCILTTKDLIADDKEMDHCGSCRKCLDICPTNAFPAPYQLDARRCISYLTIEHKGHIDREFRHKIGNRIYGCDDCLAVCPWNKFAKTTNELKLKSREDIKDIDLSFLLSLNESDFRQFFSKSPIKRIKRDRFLRNVLIAAGNSNNQNYVDQIIELLRDENELVRAMSVWALSQLLEKELFLELREEYLPLEKNKDVLDEWLYSNKAELE